MAVRLIDIDRDNWLECIKMSPGPGNEDFVAPNVFSIAESRLEPTFVPMAIYDDAAPVGFLMYGVDAKDGRYWLIRFMIDARYQSKGLGRAALQEVIKLIRDRHGIDGITLSYKPENLRAKRFYAAAGFIETGEMNEGEVVARLQF
jgi:diamine N-acetyltransferase